MVSRPGHCRLVFLRRRGWTGRTDDGGDRGGRHLSVSRARVYRRIMLKRKIELPPEHLYPADEWRIVEARYSDEFVGLTETVFSLGNGFVGIRGSFEEGARRWFPGRSSTGSMRPGQSRTPKGRMRSPGPARRS
jgi:Glycosyl hydrolase family 65, N-terminal domain